AHRPLFVHGERVAVHPEQIEHEIAAEFIAIAVLARLQPLGDLRAGRGLLAEVAPDDGGELLQRLENRKVQLRKKVSRKNNSTMRINDERLQRHEFPLLIL